MPAQPRTLSIEKAAAQLHVSAATIRNWVKQGYLTPFENRKSTFRASDVAALKKKIIRGDIDRLRRRANKRHRETTFIPEEYLTDHSFVQTVTEIQNCVETSSLDSETAVFILGLKLLSLKGEVSDPVFPLSDIKHDLSWKRASVKAELSDWFADLQKKEKAPSAAGEALFQLLDDASHSDALGIIYQSLLQGGSKSRSGSYYTPETIVLDTFTSFPQRGGIVLDPCCGTGQFLICATRCGHTDPALLYGFDTDATAVRIARINLLLACGALDFTPHIHRADILSGCMDQNAQQALHHLENRCRLIATNPPWGASLQKETISRCRERFPEITSRESFSFILAQSIGFAEQGGGISFVLPESFLNIRTHADIRSYVLKHTQIQSIHDIGRTFKGVFTPVIKLDLVKRKPPSSRSITIKKRSAGTTDSIPQKRFRENDFSVFDIHTTSEEHTIIKNLYRRPHITLKGRADWALGIVTGNNKLHLSSTRKDGMEPIFKGSDIQPYRAGPPKWYIAFRPDRFQQVAPEEKYRAPEKLLYRFISERLVFAYDTDRSLTLNSANILIPRIEDYPMKVILSLFNSKLYHFLYLKKFTTRKVLRGDLERLPLPLFSSRQKRVLEALADRAITDSDEAVFDEIDRQVMRFCGLSGGQSTTVVEAVRL